MGASSVGTQFKCSLWRHYLGHLRQWPWVLGALVVALTPFTLLAGLKSTAPPEHLQACHFEGRGLSTEWPLGLLQSFVCGISNQCQDEGQDDLFDHYPGAAVNELVNATYLIDGSSSGMFDLLFDLPRSLNLLKGVTDLITAPALTDLMENGLAVSDIVKSPSELALRLTSEYDLDPEVVQAFLDARVNMSRVFSLAGVRRPREVVCSPPYLAEYLVTNSTALVTDISWSLCHLPLAQAANLTSVLLASLDPGKLMLKVGEVVQAIGGYNSEILLQQVGGLVGAVGRLEALAPLASSMTPILSALRPARNAMQFLSLSMWDEASLGDFLGFVDEVMSSFTTNSSTTLTKVLEGATTAALHLLSTAENPANLTHQIKGLGDSWEAALTDIGVTTHAVVAEIEAIPHYLRERPILRSLLTVATAGLSTLLRHQPYNTSRLEEELDEALTTLLEETRVPLNGTFALKLLPMLHAADAFTKAADAMASLVVEEPPLPLLPSLGLLTTLSNCSQLKTVLENEGLDSWLCGEESLSHLSPDDQNTLSERLCSDVGKEELGRITQLLQKALNYSQETQDRVSASEVMEAVRKLLKTLEASAHLHQALVLAPSGLTPSLDLEGWWGRWQPDGEVVVVGEVGGNGSGPLLPVLPSLGSEGFQDLEGGVEVSKYIIHKLVTNYLDLVGGECGGAAGALSSILPPRGLQNTAEILTSVLDTLVHLAAVTQEPWRPGDLLRHPNMTTFLTRVLPPNVMVVVTRGLEVAQYPWVEVPAPIPQLLALLNATHSALTAVLEEDDVWAWCGEGSCPHLANLTSRAHLLPHLAALPYFINVVQPGKDVMQILGNRTAWRYYPCHQNTTNATTTTSASLTLFFPPAASFTPAAQPTVEEAKKGVRDLEEYVCQNFDVIVDELTSNEDLTSAVKAFMDRLTPETINLGASVGLLRSLWDTVTQLDLPVLMTNLTGGSLALEDWERPFTSLAINTGDPKSVLMGELEKLLTRLLEEGMWNGTPGLYRYVTLGFHAAHNITTALTDTLQRGDVTLAEILGLSGDDPLFSLLARGPQGLADYLLHEMNTSVISAVMDRDLEGWASGLCNRSRSRSPWVEVVCNYTNTRVPPSLVWSNLSMVVKEAVTQFQRSEAPQPPLMSPSQLLTDLEELMEALRQFDFTAPPDVTAFDGLVNTMRREADTFLAGLRVMQEDWPFLLLDALLQKGPREAQAVLRETNFALSLLLRGLPASSGTNTTSPVTELYQLLNTSWVELVAGIHYNIHREAAVANLTAENVCGPNSTLEEPEGGDGSFLEAVEKMCLFVSSNADVFDDVTYTQNTSSPLPSTRDVYHKSRQLVSLVQQLLAATRDKGLRDILGWPSYFVKDNWRTLLARIYPSVDNGSSTTTEALQQLVPSVVVALRWLGVPQNSTVPKNIVLQIKWMDILLAQDMKEVLNTTLVLSGLADTLTHTSPRAVKDLVDALTRQPKEVGQALVALQEAGSWTEVCQLNTSALGSHLTALLEELCALEEDQLMKDLRSLLGLDLLRQPDPVMSTEEALESLMAYVITLDKMDRVALPLAAPGGLVKYLGLQRWMDLPSDAFNVTLPEMESNSTMILAAVLGPLVAQAGEETREGRHIRVGLAVLSSYLRLTRWLLVVSSGNLREAYMDKPMVIHFLDLLDQAPLIAKEYVGLLSQSSALSEVMEMRAELPCRLHISLLEKHFEEVEEGAEGMTLLNNTVHFLCEDSTRLFLLNQLKPGTLPVIVGERMNVDAATLAHLLTDVGRGVAGVAEGRHGWATYPPSHPPAWLAGDRWQGVYHKLQNITKRPVMEMALEVAFLGLSAAQTDFNSSLVVEKLPSVAPFVYHLSRRLADAINESSGRVDPTAAVKGLGSVEELVALMAPRLPALVSLVLWLPESYATWKVFREGYHWLDVWDEACRDGPQLLLLHPGLPQQEWEDVRLMLCNFSIAQLHEDVAPVLNVTQVLDGEVVDLALVKQAVGRLMRRLSLLDVRQLEEPFVNNAYTDLASRVSPAVRIAQGTLGQLIWMRRGAMEGASNVSRFIDVQSMMLIVEAVEPIAKQGAPSLLERLVDPDEFVQLLKDYQTTEERMKQTVDTYFADPDSQVVGKLPMYGLAYSEAHATLFNVLEALAPRSPLRIPWGSTLQSILNNVLYNGGELIKIRKDMICIRYYRELNLSKHLRRLSQWLALVERQLLGRMEEHVDVMCRARPTNLTVVLRSLWEDLGWKEEVMKVANEEYGNGTTTYNSCGAFLDQLITTYNKLVEVVWRYGRDEPARTRLTSCLGDAVNSDAGQQLVGLMVVTENFLQVVSKSPKFARAIYDSMSTRGILSRVMRRLLYRISVLAPLEDVLVTDYHLKMNMSGRVWEATRHLRVDVKMISRNYYNKESLAALSETLEEMQKWLKMRKADGTNQSLTWVPEEEETPLEVVFKFAESRGALVFASDLIDSLDNDYLLTQMDSLRIMAILSLEWLDPFLDHLTLAIQSVTELSRSGSFLDLDKIISGEDPLSVLSGSVKFIQMEEWNHLAQSFQGLIKEGARRVMGYGLSEDLQSVVDGVNSVLAARDVALQNFKVPITNLVVNWTGLEDYLLRNLKMDSRVVEALATSQLNMLALLSLEGSTAEEVVCEGRQMGRLLVLPANTQVTPTQLSAALCSSNDSQALAATFLSHLNLTPLMSMLTRFGVNTSLSSRGVSLGEVAEAVKNIAQTSEHMPTILTTLRAFHNLSEILLATPRAERIVGSGMAATIGNITSPEFLERAGQALCGRPLTLMPDKFGLQQFKGKKTISTNKKLGVCERLHEDLRTLPGGGLLLHYIKPLLTGKIFYTPDNSITRAIIAQANKTFEAVDQQRHNLRRLSQQAKGMISPTDTQLNLKKLEKALESPWVQGAMKELLHTVPSMSSFDFSSMPSISSLAANLKDASPQLLESSQLVREFSDVLEVGVSLMSCLELQRFIPVNNESRLLEKAHEAVEKREFLAGVVFQGVGQSGGTETVLPTDLTYAIRVDYSKSPPTFLLGPKFWRPGPYADMAFYMRYQQGFIQLQETLEEAILNLYHQQAKAGAAGAGQRRKRSAGSPLPLTEEEEDLLLNLPIHTKQQPYPCYTKDDFLRMVNESPVMSFIFSFLSLVLFCTFIIQELVRERESRNKQLQEVMGLRLWLDHLVWLLCSLLLLLVIVLLSAFLLSFGGLQPRADLGVLIAFLWCYGLSVVSFCYMVACLVPTVVLAVFTGVMMLLVFNIPFVSISVIQAPVSLTVHLLTCLLPSTAFGFGFRIICQYELVEEGANHANMWIPPTKGSEMTLGLAITMLLLDTLLFFVITLVTTYFKNEVPRQRLSQGGSEAAPKRSSFMQHFSGKQTNKFTLNVFPECRAVDLAGASPYIKVAPGKDDVSSIKKEAIHIVDLDLGLKQSLHKGLSITGLRKIYHQGGSGSRVAVDGISLDLYEGQVLALLGHNGAGKTTIISMLTHEVKPTAGKILVYGEDINTSEGWEKARQVMGLCPQESVLFPLLTVEETLAYYTTLKQRPSDPPPTDISKMLANMDLLEHRHFLSHQLSEGLRRRLCMALAFVGHSKLVILDEPTSGIDPAARSVMWEMISNNRSGRTILLTTHHLDEAETLADRVAVLNKGRLLCVGSPLALKSEYGLGYSITLSKASPPPPLPPSDIKADPMHPFTEKTALSYCELPFKVLKSSKDGFGGVDGGDKDRTWELLTRYVPNTRLLESVNGEVTYSLPIHDAGGNTNRLPELFGELEGRLDELGYTSMELRPTSLEDVIIALNTINSLESSSFRRSSIRETPLTSQKDLTTTYDFALDQAECCVGLRRLGALLHKRLLHHGRDWHFYVQMFLLPFLFILLAMVASKFRPSFSQARPITLDPSLYPAPATTFLRTLDPTLGPLADEVTQLSLGLQSRPGNWSSCPEFVADTNPGLEECSISESSVQSACQCVEERCVVEASAQPSLNDWILATRTHHVQTRHGGITLGVKDPREGEKGRSGAVVWYDNAAYHALPTYINLLNNARLRRLAGPQHTITAINHPIVFTLNGMWSMSIQQHVADLGIGLLVLVALTVVCSATVGCMVAERVRGERRLLYLAGLSKTTYWFGSTLWDTGVVVLNVLLIAAVFLVFKEQQFIWRENLWAFILLALLYGLSILPLFYLMENWFRTEASAVFFFFCSFFGVGLITTLLLVVCQVMSYIKGMNDTAAVIKYLFLVFPPFTFTCSLKDMAASYTRASIMARFDMDLYQSPFIWDPELQGGLGVYMVALSVWAVVGWALLLCPRPTPDYDPLPPTGVAEEEKDVAAERIKIQCGGTSLYDTVLRLVGLGRDFSNPAITAVANLFLAVRRGECFSLLGLNGAGKTTTFRCLTGDLRPSRGQILVNGLLLEDALELSRPILSYCPQSNALDPNLTPREVLTNMARIRGASGPRTQKVVEQAIKQLGLSIEANTYVRHLSGGNKRKLSVALSLLGNPLLVLMDEPTTGMDPASRRLVWRAIQSVSQDGRSVLLTSHSMDEVNQLSHRMAIMVNGSFVCLGSPHYLKHRLGDKYTVRLKTRDIEDLTYVVDYLRSHLMEVLLKEQHHLSLVVEVSRRMPLQLIFNTLNGAKSLGVTEYNVSQTTLNEVFRVLTSYQGDGYAPRPTSRVAQSQDSLPSLFPHHYPAMTKALMKDDTFQQHPSVLAPVECINPTVRYVNLDDVLGKRGRDSPFAFESESANDSPEEEWTPL